MDGATRKKIALLHVLWGSLVVGLALLILASFLTGSIPHWMGLLGAVAATALAPIFIKRILRLRKSGNREERNGAQHNSILGRTPV
jgi:hypothetical protein